MSEESPLVTFALFAYNQEKYIREAVESALAQDYTNLEILISDDHSDDATFEIAKACVAGYRGSHRIELIRNEVNLGWAGHLNTILERARGDYVCWAAGDDVSSHDKVSMLVAPMLACRDVVGVHSFVNEIDPDGRFISIRKPDIPELIDSPKQVVDEELQIISQSHMFRRSVWEKFGPVDESVTNEGAVMAFREACCGKVLLVPLPLTNYRVGVGVSTQRGRTLDELAISEPVKYARWWATGFRQISRDLIKYPAGPELVSTVKRKVGFFEARLRINEAPWQFRTLMSQFLQPGFVGLVKAFVRRNAPRALLRFVYRRAGWL